MLFENLYNLINEHNKAEAISFEDLAKYYYYHIGAQDRNASAINNYLKDNNISNRYAMVVIDVDEERFTDYYYLLVSKVMARAKRSKLVKEVKTLVGPMAQHMLTQYKGEPAENIYNGHQYIFDPMDKYDLDDETKETWKDIITNL